VILTWVFASDRLTFDTLIFFVLLVSFMLSIGIFFYPPSKRQVLRSRHKQIELRPKSICVIYEKEKFRIRLDELFWKDTQSCNPLFMDDLYDGIQKKGIIFFEKDRKYTDTYYMPLDDNEMIVATEWLRNSTVKEQKDNKLYSLFLLLLPATGMLLFLPLGLAVCLIMNVDYGSAMYAMFLGYFIMLFFFIYLCHKKFSQ